MTGRDLLSRLRRRPEKAPEPEPERSPRRMTRADILAAAAKIRTRVDPMPGGDSPSEPNVVTAAAAPNPSWVQRDRAEIASVDVRPRLASKTPIYDGVSDRSGLPKADFFPGSKSRYITEPGYCLCYYRQGPCALHGAK